MFTQTAILDNQRVHTRLLFPNDRIQSARIQNMPTRLNGKQSAISEWATQDISIEPTENCIIQKVDRLVLGYYTINDSIDFGRDQHVLINRVGYWQWKPIWKVKQDDQIYSTEGNITVKSNEFVKKMSTIPEILTDNDDASFVNRVLVYTGGLQWL